MLQSLFKPKKMLHSVAQRGGPIRCLSSSMGRSLSDGFGVAPLELLNRVVSVTQADGLG